MVDHFGGSGSNEDLGRGFGRSLSLQMEHTKRSASSSTHLWTPRRLNAWIKCLTGPCPVAECSNCSFFWISAPLGLWEISLGFLNHVDDYYGDLLGDQYMVS